MNIAAAVIASALGAALFAAEMTYFYRPPWINADHVVGPVVSSDHSKARAAVSRLLIVPSSAKFTGLSEVEMDKMKLVCGAVSAQDKTGHYSGYRDFVYTVASDTAGIDDDGQITHSHGSFSTCRRAPQKKPDDPHKTTADGDPVPAKSASSGGQSVSSSTSGAKVGSGSSAPPQMSSISNTRSDQENGWRSDRIPTAWPTYPSDHPLNRPTRTRTPAQAMALARNVEDRWERSSHGSAKDRPALEEVQEARRALLSISPNDKSFPKAWSAFVRLQKIESDLTS